MNKIEDDFYDSCNLVEEEDIEKAKNNPSKKPVRMSHSYDKTSYEEVSDYKEVNKEDIFRGEPTMAQSEEDNLVHYEIIEDEKKINRIC